MRRPEPTSRDFSGGSLMKTDERPLGSLRPTVGHHFAALLQCPQKAWLDYHADPRLKSEPTAYLKVLQREGLDHERAVSARLYPRAVRIPERGDPDRRAAETVRAMQSGAEAVLQAYFQAEGACGVADVLERVGPDQRSRTGYVYRIGEFKRATALSTGHVMQVAWYDELLAAVQGFSLGEGFFILGDGTRTSVRVEEVRAAFEACKRELVLLRAKDVGPGPHLSRWCSTCQWRAICLPQLVERRHVSLLPGVSRRHAEALAQAGVHTWDDLSKTPQDRLEALGFDGPDARRMGDACQRLRLGEVVLRYSIKSDELARFTALTLDFGDDERGTGRSVGLLPRAVWYEELGEPREVPVVDDPDRMATALNPLIQRGGLAFYGATDLIAFLKLVPRDVGRKARCVDVLDLIERLVHAPLPGLELEDIVRFATGRAIDVTTRPERVGGIRAVIDWMTGVRTGVA
jgi:hypothetical protein